MSHPDPTTYLDHLTQGHAHPMTPWGNNIIDTYTQHTRHNAPHTRLGEWHTAREHYAVIHTTTPEQTHARHEYRHTCTLLTPCPIIEKSFGPQGFTYTQIDDVHDAVRIVLHHHAMDHVPDLSIESIMKTLYYPTSIPQEGMEALSTVYWAVGNTGRDHIRQYMQQHYGPYLLTPNYQHPGGANRATILTMSFHPWLRRHGYKKKYKVLEDPHTRTAHETMEDMRRVRHLLDTLPIPQGQGHPPHG